jgi:hypothetical protein
VKARPIEGENEVGNAYTMLEKRKKITSGASAWMQRKEEQYPLDHCSQKAWRNVHFEMRTSNPNILSDFKYFW